MPASNLTTFIVYRTADGQIQRAFNGDKANPPGAGAGEAVLDVGQRHPLPTATTHKIAASALVEKSAAEQTTEAEVARKADLERCIGTLDAIRGAMFARGYSTTVIDQQIADCVAEHAALP